MDYNQICEAITLLKKSHNLSSITLSGGEPLLHPNFIEIVNMLHTSDIKLFLITNGVLLSKYDPAIFSLFNCVQVSIHNDFEDNVNLNSLANLAKNTNLVYNVVLNSETIQNIAEYERIARKTLSNINYKIQRSEGRGKGVNLLTLEDVMLMKEKYPTVFDSVFSMTNAECCYFDRNFDVYTMHSNGVIALCPSLPNKYVLGSVFEDWYSERECAISKLRTDMSAYRKKVCKQCILSDVCNGVCPGNINIDGSGQCLYCQVKCKMMLQHIIHKH